MSARKLLVPVAAVATLWAVPAAASAQPATWNFTQADVPAAQPPGHLGAGVLVAVVDTWVDPGHPQFGGRVVDEADCLPGSCLDHKYAPDSCVHGTHVAGTVASADYGVAPAADILAVQVLSGPPGGPDPSASCSGSAGTVAAGIEFAVQKGARVINLSLGDAVPGLFQSGAISAAVADAAAHGVVVVFAAGNQGIPLTDSYGTHALIVAATGPGGQLAGYSNFDSALTGDVNVAAPGGDAGQGGCTEADCILSTFPGGRLGLLEGTSMAAPHVSGLAALLLAEHPGRSAQDVISTIESTARPLAGAGSGLIDAARAMEKEPPSGPPAGTSPTRSSGPTVAASGGAPSPGSVTAVPSAGAVGPPAPVPGARAGTAPSVAPLTRPVGITTSTSPPSQTTLSRPLTGRAGAGALTVLRRDGPTDWTGHHAGILVVASLLLAADLLALIWTRESRRLFGR